MYTSRNLLKFTLRNLFASAFQRIGLFNFLMRRKTKLQPFILMYHRIIPSVNTEKMFVQPGMYVSAKNFQQQVETLRSKFNVLPLPVLIERLINKKTLNGCCAITFDDGWKDNYTYAFPILRINNLPATIFLTTGFIGTNKVFWPEELTYYLKKCANVPSRCKEMTSFCLYKLIHKSKGIMDLDYAIQIAKKWNPKKRDDFIALLRNSLGNQSIAQVMLNWEDVMEMKASGLVDFGSHTVNHTILDQIPLAEAEKEILNSLKKISFKLGAPPSFFAYPNGNHGAAIRDILKENGIKGAVTTHRSKIGDDADPFRLPRIGIHEDITRTSPLFLARLLLTKYKSAE